MAAPPGRSGPPSKPWERAGTSDGPSPFAPPSNANSTAAVVAASGATPGTTTTDQKDENGRNVTITDGVATGRPMPPRPWEQNRTGYGTGAMSSYGGYGGGMYGGGLGSSTYGGGMYGGGVGSSMYGSSFGGGMYGSRYGGYGGYGGMGGSGYGGGYGGYGMGNMGGGFGMGPGGDPNFPGGPPQPPNFWQNLLQGLSGVMQFFGRLAMLVNENTQAFHFFISALLQLCDRAGSLYGELARFVLHVLGFRMGSKARARSKASERALEGAELQPGQNFIAGPTPPEKAWDNVWQDESGPR
ncbi:unnamed protein product [Calypogeia fissa]